MTTVHHIKENVHDVYIGRGSKWGNPYPIRKGVSREEVIERYETYARKTFTKEDLKELVNKKLGCFCAPLPCHGDVLIKLMKEFDLE